jgi:hypothetical protein
MASRGRCGPMVRCHGTCGMNDKNGCTAIVYASTKGRLYLDR